MLEMTIQQYARLLSCQQGEVEVAIKELSVTKIADVTIGNENVTVINRRMYREERERKLTRSRVKKYRETEKERESNAPVTVPSSSSSSFSYTKSKHISRESGENEPVDNSSGNGNSKDAFLKKLKTLLENIRAKYPDPYFNHDVELFLQTHHKKNPDAILHCLESILKVKDVIKKPKQYLEAAIRVEDGKYNAAESERISDGHKSAPINLGAILQGIGKPMS